MRRLVVSLALVACRPQPGAQTRAEGSSPPASTGESQRGASPHEVTPGDRDADGVPDASDRCPDEPEDRDGFEDEDGCVDRDNDGDGVPDAHEFIDGRWTNCDRMIQNGVEVDCRNRPEDPDGVRDHDGCPDILRLSQCSREIGERVQLGRGGRVTASAGAILDGVAAAMKATPGTQIWVEAHLDAQRDAAAAERLTRKIAEDVVAELVRRGVERERMEPIGWGDRKPIDRNTTAAGRANNRRVEFELQLDEYCEPRGRPPQAPDCR